VEAPDHSQKLAVGHGAVIHFSASDVQNRASKSPRHSLIITAQKTLYGAQVLDILRLTEASRGFFDAIIRVGDVFGGQDHGRK
jgi:hypothetical protein